MKSWRCDPWFSRFQQHNGKEGRSCNRYFVMPDELFTPVTQPSSASDANRIVVLEEGVETHTTKSYGIGIDCHSKFIQVSVLAKRDFRIYEYRREFGTDWKSLVEAKQWCIAVLGTCSIPPITFGDDSTIPFHYCIESTSNYHQPIKPSFPSISNRIGKAMVSFHTRSVSRRTLKPEANRSDFDGPCFVMGLYFTLCLSSFSVATLTSALLVHRRYT